MLNSVLVVF